MSRGLVNKRRTPAPLQKPHRKTAQGALQKGHRWPPTDSTVAGGQRYREYRGGTVPTEDAVRSECCDAFRGARERFRLYFHASGGGCGGLCAASDCDHGGGVESVQFKTVYVVVFFCRKSWFKCNQNTEIKKKLSLIFIKK